MVLLRWWKAVKGSQWQYPRGSKWETYTRFSRICPLTAQDTNGRRPRATRGGSQHPQRLALRSSPPSRPRGESAHAPSDAAATHAANPFSRWSYRGYGVFPRFFFLAPQVRYLIDIAVISSVERKKAGHVCRSAVSGSPTLKHSALARLAELSFPQLVENWEFAAPLALPEKRLSFQTAPRSSASSTPIMLLKVKGTS